MNILHTWAETRPNPKHRDDPRKPEEKRRRTDENKPNPLYKADPRKPDELEPTLKTSYALVAEGAELSVCEMTPEGPKPIGTLSTRKP